MGFHLLEARAFQLRGPTTGSGWAPRRLEQREAQKQRTGGRRAGRGSQELTAPAGRASTRVGLLLPTPSPAARRAAARGQVCGLILRGPARGIPGGGELRARGAELGGSVGSRGRAEEPRAPPQSPAHRPSPRMLPRAPDHPSLTSQIFNPLLLLAHRSVPQL